MPLKVKILGVPLDLGQTRRGVDMGPSAIRAAGLQSRLKSLVQHIEDDGNLPVVIAETQPVGDSRARYWNEIADVCRGLSHRVSRLLEAGWVPLVLGGDHSLAIGTIAGIARHDRRLNQQTGLIWLDAHPDMNTPETTPSGNVHGMALACCLGLGPASPVTTDGEPPLIDPERVALVGVRCVDDEEKQLLRDSGVRFFTMRDIDEHGMRKVMQQAIGIACSGGAGFHVSLDMDFVDPREAAGVGTPCPGGVNFREAHLAMEMIADSEKMLSFEVVEVNPILDVANHTAALAVGLTLSAFGQSIV